MNRLLLTLAITATVGSLLIASPCRRRSPTSPRSTAARAPGVTAPTAGAARRLHDPVYLALVARDALRDVIARGVRATAMAAGALALCAVSALPACPGHEDTRGQAEVASASVPACAPDNGGITLPDGFCATVFADKIGHARHLVVSPDGAVYVNTWSGKYYGNDKPPEGGFLVALRDTTGDGVADQVVRFGDTVAKGGTGGTGIALHDGALYAEAHDRIVRYRLSAGSLAPTGDAETIVQSLPITGDHPMHPFAIDASGGLYMDSGSATNACQIKNRIPRSPGDKPCTELETRAGIWRYDANRTSQLFSPAERYATGIRNAVGIALDSSGRGIWATQHGRDQLTENWPNLYTPEQGANLPAEGLLRVEGGDDYGWPECYFDNEQRKLVLAPEYGGEGGQDVGPCASKRAPIAFYPAHWASNALLFYSGDQFPARYRGGAFIAFHGSWNRAPFPQEGYNVVFQPFESGKPSGDYEVFADGFAGAVKQPGQATHRPVGLAVGPDGALYLSEDVRGTIWRVLHVGANVARLSSREAGRPRATPGTESGDAWPAGKPVEPPEGIHPDAGTAPAGTPLPPSPPQVPAGAGSAGITAELIALGDRVYHGQVGGATCVGCHGTDAKGTPLGADLADDRFLWGDGSYTSIVKII
jgi:glucose/arabinose dehydrogenase